MSDMIERVARAVEDAMTDSDGYLKKSYSAEDMIEIARGAIEAMRELPEEPGPRYRSGEYSRRSQAAMVDDALE